MDVHNDDPERTRASWLVIRWKVVGVELELGFTRWFDGRPSIPAFGMELAFGATEVGRERNGWLGLLCS